MNEIERTSAVDEVALWRLAVETQHRRILADHDAVEDLLAANIATVDLRLYAVALRNLLRAVRFAIEAFPEHATQLRRAEQRFRDRVPDASTIRDILEHFDEYGKGTGKLVRKSGFPPALTFRFAPDGTRVGITLYRYSDDDGDVAVARRLELDTAAATAAAMDMADRALHLID